MKTEYIISLDVHKGYNYHRQYSKYFKNLEDAVRLLARVQNETGRNNWAKRRIKAPWFSVGLYKVVDYKLESLLRIYFNHQ